MRLLWLEGLIRKSDECFQQNYALQNLLAQAQTEQITAQKKTSSAYKKTKRYSADKCLSADKCFSADERYSADNTNRRRMI